MHKTIQPTLLYFGTPLVFGIGTALHISTRATIQKHCAEVLILFQYEI